MLSPSGFTRGKSGSIVGDLGTGLLSPKKFGVLKRGVNRSPVPNNAAAKIKSPQGKPGKTGPDDAIEEEDEDDGKPKTVNMKCGIIQFKDIIVPPSAPTDLICEECEVAISVLHCGRCRQVFCMKCAESCHPKPYGKDNHPHEVEEQLRFVQFGDTSRIKHEVKFVLPDVELHEEDYLRQRDLSKPNSLSTTLEVTKPSFKPHKAPKFDIHQVVLFKDPHTEKEAYGKIISQWDQRHGTMATPAILRGNHSVVYYMVQCLGYTHDIANVATLVPKLPVVEKIDNFPVIEGVEIDEMMHHRKRAHAVDKKIAAAEGIKRLGPKHHLRDVVSYNYFKDQALLENREYNLNSTKVHGDQLLNSAIYNSNLDDMSECVTIASSTASQRQLAANKHRKLRLGTNNDYIINPVEFKDTLYDTVDLNLYADIDTDVQSQLSFDNPLSHPYPAYHRSYQHILNGPIDDNATINSSSHVSVGESSSGAPHGHHQATQRVSHHAHTHSLQAEQQQPTQTDQRQLIQAQRNQPRKSYIPTTKHVTQHGSSDSLQYDHTPHNQHQEHSVHYGGHSTEGVVDLYTKRALQVLVLGEHEMCTVQERIASEIARKNHILQVVWNKMSGSEKMLMKHHGFQRWQKNVGKLRDNQQHISAIKMQALARKYLCKDKLAEKTEEFIAKERRKREKIHHQFRYSTADDPRAVTMNQKIYFKTHLDLNRYAALLRVLMYKLAKYLARKRFAMLRGALARWRRGLATFVETDIQSSHINDIAIDYEPSDPASQLVSLDHQRDLLSRQHAALRAVAEAVVITSPDRQYPASYVDEYGHDTVISMPLRLPDIPQLDRNAGLSHQIEEWALERSVKMAQKASERITRAAAAAGAKPRTPGLPPSTPTSAKPGEESDTLDENEVTSSSERGGSRGGDEAFSSRSRPASPGLDLQEDGVSGGALTLYERLTTSPEGEGKSPPPSTSGQLMVPQPASFPVPSYFPSEGIDLPPLPTILIPRTAQERLFIKTERRLDYANYRESMIGPTFDSNWVIPARLCMGCMPWGAAEVSNTVYPVPEETPFSMSMKSTKCGFLQIGASVKTASSSDAVVTSSSRALNTATNASAAEITAKARFQTNKWKPPPVTAVSALLLNRVDYFVSLMDEEEEEAIEMACKVPSIETCIKNALATANAGVSAIISQCMQVITKQTIQMDSIPRYGHSDPRYPAASREILRCKARMQLAHDNMAKARQQIKNLPPRADFIRIPLRLDGLVTPNQLLPKIWQIEELLQQGRNLYIYSRDGHGRAGLVAGILLGRLYNLHPYEALYRIQACHDSAAREKDRAIPINCPQLPVQRELLTQILHLTNRPTEPTFVRTQIDPDTFAEHLPKRPLLYDTSGSSHASVNGSYQPTQSFLSGVKGAKHHKGGAPTVLDSFRSTPSVMTALTPRSDVQDSLNSPVGGSTAPSSAPSTARTGQLSLLKSISWRSIQLEQEHAALETAAKEHDAELGNNHEVIEAENEFLQALFAAQNIRKKQTMTMRADAPFTCSRGNGITHRGDDIPTTHTNSKCRPIMPPEPLLPDLYSPAILGQSVDVARKLPTKRPEPTVRPHLPQIRNSLTPKP